MQSAESQNVLLIDASLAETEKVYNQETYRVQSAESQCLGALLLFLRRHQAVVRRVLLAVLAPSSEVGGATLLPLP